MKVRICDEVLDIPDTPLPLNPEKFDTYIQLKRLVEMDYEQRFGKYVNISNWEYIMSRTRLFIIT